MKNRRTAIYAIVIILLLALVVILQMVSREGEVKGRDDRIQSSREYGQGTGDDPVSMFGKGIMPGTTSAGPRELTDEERRENEREFRLMREKMPDNMWLPGDVSREEAKRQEKLLRDMILFGNKVQKGTATREESRRYYSLKIKSLNDKIELIKYFQERTAEKGKEEGNEYLTREDIEQGNQVISELKEDVNQYRDKLETVR